MKIPDKMPKFEGERILAVVAAKQEGKFYLINSGTIEEISSFKFTQPKYSDREGFFMSRSPAGTTKSGSVYEAKKERIYDELIHNLEDHLKKISARNEIDKIYFSAPAHLKKIVKSGFPSALADKTKLFLEGDFIRIHPLELLEKINARIKERTQIFPARKPANKLLKKFQ